MKKMCWLVVAAMVAVTCVSMWGCSSWFEEDGERSFFDNFVDSRIVGFIDDSLVIVADDKEWSQETSNGYAVGGRGQQRLRVFNYRVQEDGPRWADTLDNYTDECDYVLGQLSDSVIWGGKASLYTYVWEGPVMSFWKIGEKPHEMKIKKIMDGCKVDFRIAKMREWFDGTIYAQYDEEYLNAGGDTCQYAVLDTVSQTITYKRLDENLKWIQKCDDVRAWGEDVLCLNFDKSMFNVYILSNDEILDSLLKDDFKLNRYANVSFIGNYMNIYQSLCSFDNGQVKWVTNFSPQGISFGDGKGNYITY